MDFSYFDTNWLDALANAGDLGGNLGDMAGALSGAMDWGATDWAPYIQGATSFNDYLPLASDFGYLDAANAFAPTVSSGGFLGAGFPGMSGPVSNPMSSIPAVGSSVAQSSSGGIGDFLTSLGKVALQAGIPPLLSIGSTLLGNKLAGGHGPQTFQQDNRTPEQKQMNQMQLGTYQGLVSDYNRGQNALPLWDPIMEQQIRRNSLAEAARSGMQDSGQAMSMVNRNVNQYKMGVAQQHEANQAQRAGQLAAGVTQMPGMQGGVLPAYNPFSSAPFDFAAINDTIGRDTNGGQPVATTQKTTQNQYLGR